jgi:hypothetical protein
MRRMRLFVERVVQEVSQHFAPAGNIVLAQMGMGMATQKVLASMVRRNTNLARETRTLYALL